MNYNLKLDYMKKELLVIRNLLYYGEYPNCFALITHHALKHNIIQIFNNFELFIYFYTFIILIYFYKKYYELMRS